MNNFPKLYSRYAKYYDRLESQYRNYAIEAKWLYELLEEQQGSSKIMVIDISCGTGNHLNFLESAGRKREKEKSTQLEFMAMDASKEMLRITRSKIPNLEALRADFLSIPFAQGKFDAAICMYWSLAGLHETQITKLFSQVHEILSPGGLFIFDVENSEGIKENLIGAPFIDAFFEDEEGNYVIRANLSTKIESDLVDWHAYYLIETGGVAKLETDIMKLRFYSREQLTRLLRESNFSAKVYSAPHVEYREHSPSLYFVARRD